MNREEVRKAAEVMLAFADDKEIQYALKESDNWMNWVNKSAPSFDWSRLKYRIKPEPKYRPFETQEECWNEMHKHPDFGWVIYDKTYYHILEEDASDIALLCNCSPIYFSYKLCLDRVTFTDGTPFGIKE